MWKVIVYVINEKYEKIEDYKLINIIKVDLNMFWCFYNLNILFNLIIR